MFNLRVVFSNTFKAVQTGLRRLKEGIRKVVLHLVHPQERSRCPPHIADPMDNIRDRVLVISGSRGALDNGFVAYADAFPMVTLPIGQRSSRDPGEKGAQSARALFLNPLQPLSPMGVFEISSNAYSLPLHGIGMSGFPSGESQPPLSSSGSETLFTPLFDLLNSPRAASTAPTTPDTDLVRLGVPNGIIQEQSHPSIKTSHSDDDIPLSALMIRGVAREVAKRNGVSGVLLSKRKDVPLWVPQPTQPNLQISPSLTVESENWVEIDISSGRPDHRRLDTDCVSPDDYAPSVTSEIALSPATKQGSVACEAVQGDSEDSNPFSWYDAWLRRNPSSSIDEKSVYSLGSYISGPSTPAQKRSPGTVPQITLTPPSVATSPDLSSHNATGTGDGLGDKTGHSHVRDVNIASLLVPFSNPIPRHRDDEDSLEDEDEAAIKRRRRNGCRLNTSSIDIIMAGLDQEFPDTPIPSPKLGPVDREAETNGLTCAIDELHSPGASVSSPSSPATTLRNSQNIADLSGETLLFAEEYEPESKFSDSSDEEDEPRQSKPIAAVPVKYSRVSWPASHVPSSSSLLSTIVEEDEESPLACHTIIPNIGSDVPLLSPSAVIVNNKIGEADVFLPASKVPKKRWYSMIENSNKRHGQPLIASSDNKRLSAPPSVLGTSRKLARAGGLTLDRPSSVAQPPILPERVAMRRPSTPAFGEAGDCINAYQDLPTFSGLVESELSSLPSSRSSNCISLYQRPWSLYVPGEELQDVQPSLGAVNDSPEFLHAEDPSSPDSDSSAFSTPTFSEVDTPDAAAMTLGSGVEGVGLCDSGQPTNFGQDATFHFAECSSSEIQGLGGILAILDSLNLSTSKQCSQVSKPPEQRASAVWEGVSDFETRSPAGGVVDECDVGTMQYMRGGWRDSDFMAYYEDASCVTADCVEEVDQAFRQSI